MWPRAHRDVDILRTVSLGSAEWRGARIHGHIVVIWVATVWASQSGFGSLVSDNTEGINSLDSLLQKTAARNAFYASKVYDFSLTISFYGRKKKEKLTHQIGAETIIDRLHRLAWVVEMDGTVMAVSFKGGACGRSRGDKSIFTTGIKSHVKQYNAKPTVRESVICG